MRKPVLLVAITVIVIFLINSCNNQPAEQKETAAAPSAEDNLKEGERLVATLDCEICHSPKRMGPKGPEVISELRFGGHQAGTVLPPYDEKTVKAGWALFAPDFTTIIGPWGQSYAGNNSSDSTGIGMWTEEQFKKYKDELEPALRPRRRQG